MNHPSLAEQTQAVRSRFDYLNHLVYLASGTSAALSIAASVLLGNAGIACAGVGTAATALLVLAPTRDRAARTTATLLVNHDQECDRRIATAATQTQQHINALMQERDRLTHDRADLSQKLARAATDLDHRQLSIDALKAEIYRLQADHRRTEQHLVTALKQSQAARDRAQEQLNQKAYELSLHLEAIEIQILDVWNPLISGLIAICDRYDPTKPVPDLEYAGKPAMLDAAEQRKWQHYRDALLAYDAKLRDRVSRMSDECDSHDHAYGFFLHLLEEMTVSYCKLWAGIKDLELLTVHEGEKRSIYSEFESFRSGYVSEASEWLEKAGKVEAGFGFIEKSFQNELASLQQRIVDAERLIEFYQQGWRFPGTDKAQDAANRIIEFLERDNIKLDAVWCDRQGNSDPGLYRVWVRERLTPGERSVLCNKSFVPHNDRLQSVGGVQEPVEIKLDGERQMFTFDLRVEPKPVKRKDLVAPSCLRSIAEFPEVVEQILSVPSSRIMGGTGGGKTSLARLVLAAKLTEDELILKLHDPLDGSPEDRWNLPKVSVNHEQSRAALQSLNAERDHRLKNNQFTPLSLNVFDEIDKTTKSEKEAKEAVLDFSKDARHCGMKGMFLGQYANVGKAGYEWSEMDNFACIYLNDAAANPIDKYPRLEPYKAELKEQYKAIAQYCTAKNRDLKLDVKDPNAHRFALAVIPNIEPFWFELPPFTEGQYNTSNILNFAHLQSIYAKRAPRRASPSLAPAIATTTNGGVLGTPVRPETAKTEGAAKSGVCPECQTISTSLKDAAENRFYCKNPACKKQSFTAKRDASR